MGAGHTLPFMVDGRASKSSGVPDTHEHGLFVDMGRLRTTDGVDHVQF